MRPPQSILPGILVLSFAAMPAIADVVAVVSVRSPIDVLSASQVVDIFLGKARNFPDGTPAVPIDQAENSTARDEFYLRVGKSAAQIKANADQAATLVNFADVEKLGKDATTLVGLMENRTSLRVSLQYDHGKKSSDEVVPMWQTNTGAIEH